MLLLRHRRLLHAARLQLEPFPRQAGAAQVEHVTDLVADHVTDYRVPIPVMGVLPTTRAT